ncbi:MAG TPA: ankyrin repeat domain-containing protein [Caulobacteraceae bacterium]|jgi:hypothetical protein
MSDPTDPVDQAYAEAEAMLNDEAARAERRARVLAAVASDGARSARPRPTVWRRGGWLAAAGVSAAALVLASQLYRPPTPYPAPAKPAAPAPSANVAKPPAPATAQAAPAPSVALSRPPISAKPAPAPGGPAPASDFTSRDQALAAKPSGAAAPPGEPPPPAPPAMAAEPSTSAFPMSEAAPQAAAAPPPAADEPRGAETGSGAVVAGLMAGRAEKSASREAVSDLGARLRAAAAAGRVSDVEALLKAGAPVDAADAEGDTALMMSIEADHPAVAAMLVQHGADPDQPNHDGQSARDLAKAVGDPKLDAALSGGP